MLISQFEYADVIFDAMTSGNADQLEILQNKCLRTCLKCEPKTKVSDMWPEAKVYTLRDRHKTHTCSIVYKGLHNFSTPGVNALISYCYETAQQDTRSIDNYSASLPKCRLELTPKNIKFKGATYYNKTTAHVKAASSFECFLC